MKRITLIFVLFLFTSVYSQDFFSELETSMERSEGGIGANVVYKVHLSSSSVKLFRALDFDTGVVVKSNDMPLYFELSKKTGEEKNEILINLQSTTYVEFKIFYVKGNCNYQFDFYY